MTAHVDRKEAIRKFKERKPGLGAFAVRCTATGAVWVGSSRNLDATRNGCWFSLRSGGHPDKTLQAEWNTHGEPTFHYEILETLDEDTHALEVRDLLKEKQRVWVERLAARPLL
jgi:hypothetical protein